MNVTLTTPSIVIGPAVLMLRLALFSGCSDGANTIAATGNTACHTESVPLSATPPAPEAICMVPPGPIASVIEAGVTQQQSAAAQRRDALLDPQTIRVVTCGTGSPIPSARAQSCLAAFVNGQFLLLEAGDRAQNRWRTLNYL